MRSQGRERIGGRWSPDTVTRETTMTTQTNGAACPVPDFTNADAGKLATAFAKLDARKRNGDGDVYRGDPYLIHAADGTRATLGRELAEKLDAALRLRAYRDGQLDHWESREKPLCPGCFMVIGFNMLRELARANGQSERELARTMARAFTELGDNPDTDPEHINVILDPED